MDKVVQFPDSVKILEKKSKAELLNGRLLSDDDFGFAKYIVDRSIVNSQIGYIISSEMVLLRDALFTIEQLEKRIKKMKKAL